MNKEEKEKLVKRLKKEYEDHRVETTKKGQQYFYVNLGEIEMNEKIDNPYAIKIKYDKDTGKFYKTYVVPLGLDPKVKEQRRQERKKQTEEKKIQKKEQRKKINSLKKQKQAAFKAGDYGLCSDIDKQIKEIRGRA